MTSGTGEGSRGTLFVVATPIGNLGDITERALSVLRSVSVVAAEDTRVTRKLWSRFEIETPLVSYHAHSGSGRTAELLERLEQGDDVALVSDAGTPLVSDPGDELVASSFYLGIGLTGQQGLVYTRFAIDDNAVGWN